MPSFPGLLGLGQGQPSSTSVHHRRTGFHPAPLPILARILRFSSHAVPLPLSLSLPAPLGGVVIPQPPMDQCLGVEGLSVVSSIIFFCCSLSHPRPRPSPFPSSAPTSSSHHLATAYVLGPGSDQTQFCSSLLESHFSSVFPPFRPTFFDRLVLRRFMHPSLY